MTDVVSHEIIENLVQDKVGDEEEWRKLGTNM